MEDDFVKLRRANGAEDWRDKKSRELGDLVQRRLKYLQVVILYSLFEIIGTINTKRKLPPENEYIAYVIKLRTSSYSEIPSNP